MNHECKSTACPVHHRFSGEAMGELGFMVKATYVGNYMVFTDHFLFDLSQLTAPERLMIASQAAALRDRADRGDREAVENLKEMISEYVDSRTTLYTVGEGTLGDLFEHGDQHVLDNSEETSHGPFGSDEVHEMYVALAESMNKKEIKF